MSRFLVDLLGAMKVYKTELIRQQGPRGRSSRSSLRPSNTCGGGTMSVSTGNSICVLRSRSRRRTTLRRRRFCRRPADRETGRNKNQANSKPRTPHQRLIDSGVLTAEKTAELAALFQSTNPAELTRQITAIQTRLIHLAAAKTAAISAGVSRAKPGEARTHLSRAS